MLRLKEYSPEVEPQNESKTEWNIRGEWMTPGWLCTLFLCIEWLVSYLPDCYDDSFFFFFLLSTGGWRNNSIQTQQDSRSLQQRSFPAVILSSSSLSADNRERLIHLMRWGDEEDWVDDCSPEFPDWIKPSKSIVASWNTVCMLQQLSGASNNRIQMCFCDCYSPFG